MEEFEEFFSSVLEKYSGEERKNAEQKIEKIKELIEKRKAIYSSIEERVNNIGELILEYNDDVQLDTMFDLKELRTLTNELTTLSKELGIDASKLLSIGRSEINYFQGNSQYIPEKKENISDLVDKGENVSDKFKEIHHLFHKRAKNAKNDIEKQHIEKLDNQLTELEEVIQTRIDAFQQVCSKIRQLNKKLLNPDELATFIAEEVNVSLQYLSSQDKRLKRLAKEMNLTIDIPLYPNDIDKIAINFLEQEQKNFVLKQKNDSKDKKVSQPEQKNELKQEMKPELKKPVRIVRTQQEQKSVDEKINVDAIRNTAKDFYYSRNAFQYNFTANDRLFFANNTLEQIKERYGDLFPTMSDKQEKLFHDYIKFMAREDGYYLDPSIRYLVKEKELKELIHGESVDLNFNTDYYKRFFNDCENQKQENLRWEILYKYACLPLEHWKRVDDYYLDLDKRTIRKGKSVSKKELKEPQTNNESKVTDNIEKNLKKEIRATLEPLHIKIKGNKMYINGKEYDYEPYQEFAQDKILQEVKNNPIYQRFFTDKEALELNEMRESLYNNGKNILLDQNIIYGLLNYCSENININDEQSILTANDKIKQLMSTYMKLSNGDLIMSNGTDNILNIEYDLTSRYGLTRKEFKQVNNMAYESNSYAKVNLKPGFLTKLMWIYRKLNDKANSAVLIPKRNTPALAANNPIVNEVSKQPSKIDSEKVDEQKEDKTRDYIYEESDKIIDEIKEDMKKKGIEFPKADMSKKAEKEIYKMVDEILDEDNYQEQR